MQEYIIPSYNTIPTDWSDVPRAYIDQYVWGDTYKPYAFAQLIKFDCYGFVLRMVCRETKPRAVCTEYNQPVYTDSCLEFFAIWDSKSDTYINIEMNANGALLSCVGKDRYERIPLHDICGELPTIESFVNTEEWGIIAHIPFSILKGVYGIDTDIFASGYTFSGNFYKCGDKTDEPHYGSWNRVGTEHPDFHRPEYFGRLVIS